MTAQEHLQWAKDRALEYLGPKPNPKPTTMDLVDEARATMRTVFHPDGSRSTDVYASGAGGQSQVADTNQAYMSFISDMNKHDGTRHHPALMLGHQMFVGGMLGTVTQMRQWIEGFNC